MTRPCHQFCQPLDHSHSRRAWLGSTAGLAAAACGLGPSLRADGWHGRSDRQVLFVWIDGGMSQLESWDPKPDTQFGGPFRSIPTSLPGIHISELMPKTAKLMHLLAVVRSLHTQDNSHSAGVPRILRGDPKNRGVTYPYFGSAVAKLMGPGLSGLPPYVWIKPGSGGFKHQTTGFLSPKHGALAFGDGQPPDNMVRPDSLTDQDVLLRDRLRRLTNERYAAGRRKRNADASSYVFETARILMRQRNLFDATQFSDHDVERYGRHEFGRHMLLARNMLEAGVRFVQVTSYGWDTHGDNFNGHASLMPRFDQSFASMIEDLQLRGMLENVLVIAMSEFGRTPRINGHVGRDHWPEAWSLAMSGAGLQRGVVVGKTNATGTFVDSDEVDIGHMFHTWFHALGIDSAETEYDNAGQPLPIAHDDCGPVREVLA